MNRALTIHDEVILRLQIRRARLLHGVKEELTVIRKQLKVAMVKRTKARNKGTDYVSDPAWKLKIDALRNELAYYEGGNIPVSGALPNYIDTSMLEDYDDGEPSEEEKAIIEAELREHYKNNPPAPVPRTPFETPMSNRHTGQELPDQVTPSSDNKQ